MDAADLRALAQEREARRRPAATASPSAPLPASWAARKPPPAAAPSSLLSAHRSIRLARMFAVGLHLLTVLCLVLGCGRYTIGLLFLGGLGLARGGGAFLHGLLPPMLLEAQQPPTAEQMAAAATVGLYSLSGVKDFGNSAPQEWALALDSLAFVCTYGKKNCLTDAMYSGELSLGKITGLVWGKLREGVIRC